MTTESPLALCLLPETACIGVSGSDASEFLHAQLSQRVAGLMPWRAPLAAWCDARGRLRALLRLVAERDTWLMLTNADQAAAVVAEMRRYVLRSAVELAIREDLSVFGALGATRARLAAEGITLSADNDASEIADGTHWLRIGPDLIYAIAPADRLASRVASGHGACGGEIALAEIRLGLPSLPAGLENLFLPQMLNLDRLGGIAFDKGCYPGQEIIARTHNLGSVKRRMRRFGLPGGSAPRPGMGLLDTDGEPAGTVIRAATSGAGNELLAVIRLDRVDTGVFLESAAGGGGAALEPLPLPYD